MAHPPPDIPGFECHQLLGEGAMGSVWRAHQVGLKREVALKILKEGAGGVDARARLVREAAVLSQARHPHLVELLDAGEGPDGAPWLAMELVEGRSLEQVLLAEGALEVSRARRLMTEVAAALTALHALGLIHRDVKPGNVMVGPRDRAVLMDLGIARGVDGTDVTASGMILGTLAYLSPEVLRGAPPEPSDDWYAWAITWWHLLTGKVPVPPQEALALAAAGRFPSISDPVPVRGELPIADRELLRAFTRPRGERPQGLPGRSSAGLSPGPAPELSRGAPSSAAPASQAPRTRPVALVSDLRTSGAPTRVVRAGAPGPRRPLLALAACLCGGLLAWMWPRPAPTVPRARPTAAPTATPLTVTATWRGSSDLLIRVAGTGGLRPRALRILADHPEPAAVYQGAGEEAWVWLAGLTPEESGSLRFWIAGSSPPREGAAAFGAYSGAESPPPAGLPSGLGRVFPRSSAGRARSAAALDQLKRALPWTRSDLGQPLLLGRMALGKSLPDGIWPSLLDWIAREEGANNLLQALRTWEVEPPEAVKRQVLHLLPALDSRGWLLGGWAARARMADLAYLEHRCPADLVPMLEEWITVAPETSRGVLAIALALARARKGAGDGPLGRMLVASHRGPLPGPTEIPRLPAAERPFAIALLGARQEHHRHIPWLFEVLGSDDLLEATAADAALEVLHHGSGAIWNCGDEGTLWFWGIGDEDLVDLRLDPPGLVTHRHELGRIWAWIPGRHGEIRWRHASKNEDRREKIGCY